jgi:phosphoglycolate phosphatase-like HAD superfamily hydrolase
MKTSPRLLGRAIEVHHPQIQRGRIRHAVFDFDGTLSLLRAGWQEVMITHAVEELSGTPAVPPPEGWRQFAREYITRLTGEQTIYQMLHLEAEVRRLGGTPRPAAEYKWEYLRRLGERIRGRLEALRQRRESPTAYLVSGSIELLEDLARRGVTCYLASGTDHPFVVEEAGLLGVAPYFGDGYVEIANAVEVEGLAVGAATCEEGGQEWDEWKKGRLLEVGADLLVPHWQESELLLEYLFGEVN